MRRARLLAFFLDVAVLAAAADALASVATGLLALAGSLEASAVRYPWRLAGGLLIGAFLLRDAGGGLAKRWLALAVRRPDGSPATAWDSAVRNLPLLVPVWNLLDALPVARQGEAARFGDRVRKTRVVQIR